MFLMIRVGLRAHLAILWKFGDANGRLFLLLLLAYLFVISASGAWLFWATWVGLLPFEVLVSFALAVSTGPAFASPLLSPMYSAPVLRRLLGRGWNTVKKPFFEELARYLESEGEKGGVPGGLKWGLTSWGVYYSTMASAILFSVTFFSSLGPWTPFVFAGPALVIAAGFSLWHMAYVGKKFVEAKEQGFRLLELQRATRDGGF